MGVVQRVRETRAASKVERLTEELERSDMSLDYLSERIAELELALDDDGWQRLGRDGESDFTADGRKKLRNLARVMYLKNPLIRRGVNVQAYYVMGQGVTVAARNEIVGEVVGDFMDDPANTVELTGYQALEAKEINLQLEGEIFFVFFTNKATGRVRVRSIPPDEITQIVTNPDDRNEAWYFLREWQQDTFDMATGKTESSMERAFYPDWRYHPTATHPESIGGVRVEREIPAYQVKVGTVGQMKFGIPDVYAALEWARVYRDFLSDWATISKSLSTFAWKIATKGQKTGDVKKKFATNAGINTRDTNPNAATGSMFIAPEGTDVTAIGKSGANISADDGRQLRTMIAAAMDIPDSILANDPQQGALATAKTLDRPTELAMNSRQQLWRSVFQDITEFVVRQAVVAPGGKLTGVVYDDDGRWRIDLEMDPTTGESYEATVDVTFPAILEKDTNQEIQAIISASTRDGKTPAGTIPERTEVQLYLNTLGVQDAEDILSEMFPEPDAPSEDPVAPTDPAMPAPTAESLMVKALAEIREFIER